jgi:hypothetical protein
VRVRVSPSEGTAGLSDALRGVPTLKTTNLGAIPIGKPIEPRLLGIESPLMGRGCSLHVSFRPRPAARRVPIAPLRLHVGSYCMRDRKEAAERVGFTHPAHEQMGVRLAGDAVGSRRVMIRQLLGLFAGQ